MATLDRHGGTGRRSAWTSRAAARTQRGRRHWLIGVAVVAAILVPLSMSGVSSAADDTPRPQGAGPHGISTMAIELGPPITRSEIIARADTWMHPPVPYNQDANKDGYRTDCSGYVSMAWKLPQNLWTGNLDQVGVPIGYNDLKAGDMLLYHNLADPVNGSHVVLFERWTGAVGGDFYIYEQSPPATKHRLWSQAGYSRSLFKPFRYKNTVEDSLGNGLSSVVYGGVLRFFGRGMDGQLIQYYKGSGVWAWQALGGNIVGTPGAVVDGTVLRVFASGTDGTPFQYYFDGAWHLASIGVGRISSGTSAVRYGGITRFFARGMDGQQCYGSSYPAPTAHLSSTTSMGLGTWLPSESEGSAVAPARSATVASPASSPEAWTASSSSTGTKAAGSGPGRHWAATSWVHPAQSSTAPCYGCSWSVPTAHLGSTTSPPASGSRSPSTSDGSPDRLNP